MTDPTPSTPEEWNLVLAFDSDDPVFARGVEVGVLHQRLNSERLPLVATVHANNAEMILRLAEAAGVGVRVEELGADWLAASFTELTR